MTATNDTSTEELTTSMILTTESLPSYLEENCTDIAIFENGADLVAKPILGGNVNYAFYVTEKKTGKSVFVKQAPEYVAIFGPDGFPLTSDRMEKEVDAYLEWRIILGPSLAEKYIPKIYMIDRRRMVFVMEFLEGFTLLDHDLVDPTKTLELHPDIATSLGTFMGLTHAATHSSKITKERVAYLTEHFENRPMRDVQLEFVFTKCYKEATDEQLAGLVVDEDFQNEIETLKRQYNGSDKNNLVLSHGDLHPGSVMIKNASGKMKIIDPEFTVYGPPGLDVGSLLSGYVLAAVHQAYSKQEQCVTPICESIDAIWNSYIQAMQKGGIDAQTIKAIEVQTVGFTVAEVCRTALEFAGDRKWLQFDDQTVKTKAKMAALKIVQNCMVERHQGGMALLISEVKAIV
eukprot:CAMPEP_0197834210 /NCGR_PEP_ID=MMETSP1437-20131217/21627_1 /TAXON_ID=49252 ORGANISM="Eucampia antarctica, Strain CCMP1452" /NCGR_SAMPLE_ID=MMETSP1437 /ASSEMBLY_ACC=CAM_ASM_001096 /LENGTH=402 /DNA_ID=CAMNT_0043438735 /DNA_START=9 /DNA_END=1217 /DNA_ORIENTATION=-